jgi:D-alanine-D-alanine ligase
VKIRVAVLHGGRSGEHEVSIRSAQAVMAGLDRERFEVVPILIHKDGRWDPRPIVPQPGANPGIDVVFPVLHGTFGEDGTVQGLLEMAALPYVGAGVFASAASMDKEQFKRLSTALGLPVVEWIALRRGGRDGTLDAAEAVERFGYPLFVKPANLGSSVGISKAHNEAELTAALAEAARYDAKIIVERAIAGPEVECAVLGNDEPQAATPCEIVPSREFYDYEDKYVLDAARVELPARLAPALIAEIRRLAVECYRAVDCSGMARVDFLVERASGRVYINEINTIPGFTSISMYPKMWAYEGLAFPRLLERLIELALERHAARQALRYER